jgi:aryl-alcohol dehydrogenase-like predicted oxidoreductase
MRYKLLGQSGMRVSELCLGTMTFGEDWGWGASQSESQKIFETFVAAGGNFIDTSNNYTDGISEKFIGEFIKDKREYFVVATKYSLSMNKNDPNAGGNHRKNMVQAVDASLKRLKTGYLDLLYLHMWDYMTGVEEVMRGLDDLIRSGKVLYAGISDTPAWVIARANTLAELRGWSKFVSLQIPYGLLDRDGERDLLPVAKAFGMSLLAWGVLSGGELTGKYNPDSTDTAPRRFGDAKLGDEPLKVVKVVAEIAEEAHCTPSQVGLAWVRYQTAKADIIPIVGARSLKQLEENLGCLEVQLSPEQLERLDKISAIKSGFPHSFLGSEHVRQLIFGNTYGMIDKPASLRV